MTYPRQGDSELRQAAAQIEATHQAIHTLQGRLTHELGALDARARGAVAQEFIRAFAQCDRELEQVKARLDELHSHLVHSDQVVSPGWAEPA